jgi:hypothetical protein
VVGSRGRLDDFNLIPKSWGGAEVIGQTSNISFLLCILNWKDRTVALIGGRKEKGDWAEV